MKKLCAAAIGLVATVSLTGAGVAGAVPTATSDVDILAQGKTYQEKYTAAKLKLAANITPEPGATSLKPLITITFNLTDDQKFAPDPKQPVCTSITETNANFPPSVAISMCPNSIVGDGLAAIYLANQVSALVTDPVITVFNGGTDSEGRGVITIHAYSASTNTGIYMRGVLKQGVLQIDVPRLTADSSVSNLDVNIPGNQGQTANYFQTKCSQGQWKTNASMLLAYRDANNVQTGDEIVNTNVQTTACVANAGKAKFGKVKVKGPKKVKANRKAKFRVTVKNNGTATARKVKLTAKGAAKGKAKGKNIAPGKKRTFTLKAKVKGKKGRKATVKVKVNAKGTKARVGKTRVKLK
jgi:hypothetical protein